MAVIQPQAVSLAGTLCHDSGFCEQFYPGIRIVLLLDAVHSPIVILFLRFAIGAHEPSQQEQNSENAVLLCSGESVYSECLVPVFAR